MPRQPPTFQAVQCTNNECKAIVALIPPGALIYDTRLRCTRCSCVVLIIKPVDSRQKEVYTELQPAERRVV